MRRIGLVLPFLLLGRDARGEIEPRSTNTVLFVQSAQPGREWEAYRLAEDRRPVLLEVEGPGRLLLSLRTFAEEEGEPAVSVVLLDDRIVLTAKVEAKMDEHSSFPDQRKKVPSKVHFYLVRVPAGVHRVAVRYSGGGPTLVAARFSEGDAWQAGGAGDLPLVMPAPRAREEVPTIGTLRASGELEAEPREERAPQVSDPGDGDPISEPRIEDPRSGPPRRAPKERFAANGAAARGERTLMVPAPWLLLEIGAGAQIDRLGLSVAPAVGARARVPVPGLDARRFSIGLSAEVSYTQGESGVRAANGTALVGVAEVRHTAFALSADLRWGFLQDQAVDPYLSIGGGALFGSMSSRAGGRRKDAGTFGGFGLAVAGAALGGLGHRPYLEARFSAGVLSTELLSNGSGPYVAASLMIGFRFELLTEVAAASP